ncbi:hypothetical protein SEA_SHAGRAT_45 [Rhodococcus phage Shagrat]|nr:hypothetical protein SEA_SHAGRAT_45 [Rhodococcus phage Shagrat]
MNNDGTPRHPPVDPEIASKIRNLGPAPESTIVRTSSFFRQLTGTISGPKHTQVSGDRNPRHEVRTTGA